MTSLFREALALSLYNLFPGGRLLFCVVGMAVSAEGVPTDEEDREEMQMVEGQEVGVWNPRLTVPLVRSIFFTFCMCL
jgi:hypothetical protein